MYSGFTRRQAVLTRRAILFANPRAKVRLIGVYDGIDNPRQWIVRVEVKDHK